MKHYTINEAGEVTEVSTFGRGLASPEVEARNKTEATAMFLRERRQIASGTPHLFVNNGAFLLTYPNGRDWNVDTGRLDRKTGFGAAYALSVGSAKSAAEASRSKDFAYYASEEYLSCQVRA